MTDVIGVPPWVDEVFYKPKRDKLDEIIYDLMKENIREFDPSREDNHLWPILDEIVKRLQKFRDNEL